jgi:AcrR family transcriptional regulator
MQDLARAAGMSAGNFYRYFPSKAAIVEALIERTSRMSRIISGAIAASSDPLAALKAGLRETLTEKMRGRRPRFGPRSPPRAARKPEVAAILARWEQGITRRVSHSIGLVTRVGSRCRAHLQHHSRLLSSSSTRHVHRLPDTAQEGELIDLGMRTIEHVIGRRGGPNGRTTDMIPLPRMTATPITFATALLAALLAVSGRSAGGVDATAEEAGTSAATVLPAITVVGVTEQTLTDRVIASGLVDAVEEVTVQPLVEGQPIDELLVDVGDLVDEGQVLARLSTSTLELQLSQLAANRASTEAQIAQAEASLEQATANAEEAERVAARDAELAEAGTVPRAQADQSRAAATASRAQVGVAQQGIASAQAQLALVDAQIENAELQLSRAEVEAPVAALWWRATRRWGPSPRPPGRRCSRSSATTPWSCAPRWPSRTSRLEPGQPCAVAMGRREPIAGRFASWSRRSTRRRAWDAPHRDRRPDAGGEGHVPHGRGPSCRRPRAGRARSPPWGRGPRAPP